MPSGLLKEKEAGPRSAKESPQKWHAFSSLITRSELLLPDSSVAIRTPLPSRRAVSTESVSRLLTSGLSTNRSTIRRRAQPQDPVGLPGFGHDCWALRPRHAAVPTPDHTRRGVR